MNNKNGSGFNPGLIVILEHKQPVLILNRVSTDADYAKLLVLLVIIKGLKTRVIKTRAKGNTALADNYKQVKRTTQKKRSTGRGNQIFYNE